MNFLITAIGSFSAECVINSLKNEGHKVTGCDIYPAEWHYVSQLCNTVYKVPFATNETAYIDELIKISILEHITYIIPLTDLEIDIINKHRPSFEKHQITPLIQSEYCLSIARNKLAIYNLFKDDPVVRVPHSIRANKVNSIFPIPAIAKPTNGRSSEGLVKIKDTKQLKSIIGNDNYLIQKFIEGPIYTVDYVRDALDNDFSIPREELLRTKNGAGTTIRITPDSILQETVSHIGKKLGIIGCVNMEFIQHDNSYYLIDINPRFSAGVAFSKCIGYDMVISHINAFFNKRINEEIKIKEQIICKHYQETILWTQDQ